jgi:hypothetical protein
VANDLATLNGYLDDMLDDGTDAVWTSAEKNNLINRAVARLWPKNSRQVDPTSATYQVTLVTETEHYALPAALLAVQRVDWVDTDGEEGGPLPSGSWEVVGDIMTGAGKLHVAPAFVERLGTLRLLGLGKYDTATNLIPDELVPLVLARARAEAYRQLGHTRVKFKNWAARNQVQNVSVNELMQMVREAQNEAEREELGVQTIHRPVPGVIG